MRGALLHQIGVAGELWPLAQNIHERPVGHKIGLISVRGAGNAIGQQLLGENIYAGANGFHDSPPCGRHP
jgi:hypothetical protein